MFIKKGKEQKCVTQPKKKDCCCFRQPLNLTLYAINNPKKPISGVIDKTLKKLLCLERSLIQSNYGVKYHGIPCQAVLFMLAQCYLRRHNIPMKCIYGMCSSSPAVGINTLRGFLLPFSISRLACVWIAVTSKCAQSNLVFLTTKKISRRETTFHIALFFQKNIVFSMAAPTTTFPATPKTFKYYCAISLAQLCNQRETADVVLSIQQESSPQKEIKVFAHRVVLVGKHGCLLCLFSLVLCRALRVKYFKKCLVWIWRKSWLGRLLWQFLTQ